MKRWRAPRALIEQAQELQAAAYGQPPYPPSIEAVGPQIHLARVQPGATVPVLVARTDGEQVLIDWNRPL
jgi:hypothetical protein